MTRLCPLISEIVHVPVPEYIPEYFSESSFAIFMADTSQQNACPPYGLTSMRDPMSFSDKYKVLIFRDDGHQVEYLERSVMVSHIRIAG